MPRKGHAPEQILNKLRQVEVAVANGKQVAQAVREIGVNQHASYRWRTEYGGLNLDQVRKLKHLERENTRLKRAVAELTLDKLILKEAAKGNFPSTGSGHRWPFTSSRTCVDQVRRRLRIKERRACLVLDHPSATQRRILKPPGDEERLTRDIIDLASYTKTVTFLIPRLVSTAISRQHGASCATCSLVLYRKTLRAGPIAGRARLREAREHHRGPIVAHFQHV